MEADLGGPDARLTTSQLAMTAGVDEVFIARLTERSLLHPESGGHLPSDVHRVRFAALAVQSGIDLDALAASIASGVARLGDVDLLFPQPVPTARMSHAELAADLDIDADLLGRVRLASGLTARGPEEPVLGDEERILRLIVELGRGLHDDETSIRVARNYGERIQRIVVSAIGAFEELVYQDLMSTTPTFEAETSRQTSVMGRALIEQAEELLTAIHRRHMETALLSMWVRTAEARMAGLGIVEAPQRLPGIAFVDLSGFTELTEVEGDEAGVWLADQLVTETEATAAAHGAHIVKLLGDGVMLHGDEPGRLIDVALELVRSLPLAGLPQAHAGVHAGPLIERDGDYFGRTVNLASRIAAQAAPGEVLVSGAAATRSSARLRLTALPPVALRGVPEPMTLYRVEPA